MLLPSAEVRVLLSGAAEWYRMWIGVEVCRGTECSCAGGARIRQLRVIDDNCTTTISPGLLTHSETFSFPCFLGFGDDTEATEPFGNSNQYNWTSADENGAKQHGLELLSALHQSPLCQTVRQSVTTPQHRAAPAGRDTSYMICDSHVCFRCECVPHSCKYTGSD